MILGIGTDIVEVSRFSQWYKKSDFIERFFNTLEIKSFNSEQKFSEYYASRFAAKEAFVKALGTGFSDFEMKEIYVTNDNEGKPYLNIEKKAKEALTKRLGECKIHLTLSHEKQYAVAFVIIEG